MKRLSLAVLCLTALSAASLAVQLPMRLNFQGKLLDPATNLPRNGTFDLGFKLYRQASGGAQIYGETQANVAVNNGVFSVQIGAVTPLNQDLFTGASAYLGITVNNPGQATESEMTPRQHLAMAPYAFTAGQLVSATDISVNPGVAYSTFSTGGNLFIAAGVTAGTATITGSLTASSGTFTASGLNQFSVTTASGIRVNGGTLDVDGAGGVDVRYGVAASTFTGDGADLTNIRVDFSSSSKNNGFTVATTEILVATGSIIPSRAGSRILVLGTFGMNRAANALSTWTLRFRRSAGSLCTTGSAQVGSFANTHTVPNTAGTSNMVSWFKIDAPAYTLGQELFYCITAQTSTGTQSADERTIALLELAP
jgi:hypothetical protein